MFADLYNEILRANGVIASSFKKTPLQRDELLSERYECNVYLKREDLHRVRSFKIRGAYNLIQSLTREERSKGVVCASAGNHAQGVAYSCKELGIRGVIFMPSTTSRQKVAQVQMFGGDFVEIIESGDTFDDASMLAQKYCKEERMVFVHPFDDLRTIAGQGTVGVEIMQQMDYLPDYIFATIGGGGLVSGVGTYAKAISPTIQIIGVEPEGAASMKASFEAGEVVTLKKIDKFVDGAAVKQVGHFNYRVCLDVIDDFVVVPSGKECTTILELYNNSAIVLEPAGALPVAALDFYKEQIRGKNVVCVVSGGNNDIERMQEIKERSLIYEGLKHYFILDFPQRAGALREFLEDVLGPNDDITRFEYTKKTNRENGPALVGIELKYKDDYELLIKRFEEQDYNYIELNKDRQLYNMLV